MKMTFLATLANAGTQASALSAVLTALTLTVCSTSETWLGTAKTKPALLAVKVQLGEPKLQVVALVAAGVAGEVTPNTTLPTDVTCTFLVTELLPAGMTKPAPVAPPVALSQLTVGVPVALKVPLTPPVYNLVHAASAQARIVSVLGAQVKPVPLD